MSFRLQERHYPWLVFLAALFLAFIGNSYLMVSDPVESNYTETAIEMIRSGDLFSPRIFDHYWYDKPIMFYWELIGSYRIFGINDFTARFPSALFSVIGVMLNYWFIARISTAKRALVSSLILLTSIEYFYIGKAIITDMTLFVFMSFTLMALYLSYTEGSIKWTYAAYGAAALATLVKGPIGLALPGMIFLFFLAWRHDLRALGRMKLASGLLLYSIVISIWYLPMVRLHDGDFILEFFGVHNLLRATVSEHPRQNVWYYYILIFLLGFAPWSFTLPLTGKPREGLCWFKGILKEIVSQHRLPQTDIRTAFFFSWAFVTFFFFQCVQTKYMTYTFPYMVPLAFGFASYLENHMRLVRGMSGVFLVVYFVLTYTVAIPQMRKASAYDAAQFVKKSMGSHTTLVAYGGRYPVSLAYYSGHAAKRLKKAKDIPAILPGNLSWNAKNMMPFMAIEAVPDTPGQVLAVVNAGSLQDFQREVGGTWQCLHDDGRWLVMERAEQEAGK
jgi:4-amino-4-deoxy-L-arabinose transferase-like glycosyltransferase